MKPFERLVMGLLRFWARAEFHRQWGRGEPPHFTDHRLGTILLAVGRGTPYNYYRGFQAAEVMHGGRGLDIGCGDGFFDRWFFSDRACHIDAVDVDPTAIAVARERNAATNIDYHLADATKGFPGEEYDVVVWDGAIGHFSPGDLDAMLVRIDTALVSGGTFVGSESLGREGSDHFQFFATLDDLLQALRPRFPGVGGKTLAYRLPDGYVRTEAYWRAVKG
jgi:SAM-dependent methyltransferase